MMLTAEFNKEYIYTGQELERIYYRLKDFIRLFKRNIDVFVELKNVDRNIEGWETGFKRICDNNKVSYEKCVENNFLQVEAGAFWGRFFIENIEPLVEGLQETGATLSVRGEDSFFTKILVRLEDMVEYAEGNVEYNTFNYLDYAELRGIYNYFAELENIPDHYIEG